MEASGPNQRTQLGFPGQFYQSYVEVMLWDNVFWVWDEVGDGYKLRFCAIIAVSNDELAKKHVSRSGSNK